jgi:hypothetical protein
VDDDRRQQAVSASEGKYGPTSVAKPVDPDDLVGAAEIAERLGILRQSVHQLRRRGTDDFPPPVAELKQGHLWSWAAVETWARSTGRLT